MSWDNRFATKFARFSVIRIAYVNLNGYTIMRTLLWYHVKQCECMDYNRNLLFYKTQNSLRVNNKHWIESTVLLCYT